MSTFFLRMAVIFSQNMSQSHRRIW